MTTKAQTLIGMAESQVPIETVLEDLFEIEVPRDAGSWKASCPQGYDHSDGGRTKAMRVYSESNSAWCFSHASKFTPLSLWQLGSGTRSKVKAARELLEHYGIPTEPPSPEERWKKLDKVPDSELLEPDMLKETFLTYARSLPGYGILQYEDRTLKLVADILDTVDHLPESASYEDLENWLTTAKKIIKNYWRRYERT